MTPATTTVTEALEAKSSGYGAVRAKSGDAGKGTLTVESGTTIQWADLTLKAGETVTTIIGPVNVMSRAQKYMWDVTLNTIVIADVDSEKDGPQRLDFYATEATDTGVAFAIQNPMDYPAGSMQTIDFMFTANATPIRDGHVKVQVPSTWTRPNATKAGDDADAMKAAKVTTDAAAKIKIGGGGTLREEILSP